MISSWIRCFFFDAIIFDGTGTLVHNIMRNAVAFFLTKQERKEKIIALRTFKITTF